MTTPAQIITRALTFNFAPSVNTATGLPDILDISVIPLSSSPNATAGATFAGGLKTAQIELKDPVNTVTFNLIPSYSPGLQAPINYRVLWRSGVLGPSTTYDFSMPDADLTFDQLMSTTGNIIDGQTYLQATDLGVPGRVARLDDMGNVLTSSGLICATLSDIASVNNNLTVEANARQAAIANLSVDLQSQIIAQTEANLNTAKAYTDTAASNINADLANERGGRINADIDLQNQITTNLNAQVSQNGSYTTNIANLTSSLAAKADLVNGTVPVAQIPDAILTSAVPAADQASMLALSPTVVHRGDLCVRPDGIFLLTTNDPSQLVNWVSLSIINSVNGQRGNVTLQASDVGAIAVGGAVALSQVTGLNTALSAKAAQVDLAAAQSAIAAIQNDTTLVHTTGGVIPSTLLDSNMVYLNNQGQLVHKDGTVIPLGSGGSGAVFSVNGQTGLVVLTAANVGAIPAGGSITQSQVTGLSTTLGAKADLVGGTVPLAELPSIPQTQVTGLSTTLSNKADLVSGLIPLSEIPVIPQTQVTGLAALIAGNQLSSSTNAVNRIAALETLVAGGGGGGGGGVSSTVPFYSSSNLTTPVVLSDFTTQVNLHSPWGIDADGTITGTTGTWYYLYTGVRSTDVAFPYITQNGHLQLHKWNEAGPADPVYALASDLATTNTTVAAKANASDLATTNATVATKANASDLTALSTTVDTKATITALNSLSTTVGTKANQSDLNTTNATIATLATQASVTSLAGTVATKANQTDMTTAQTNISALQTALPTKADLVGGVLKSTQIPTSIPQANVVGLTAALASTATLDGTGKLTSTQIPTAIPQSSITGLSTTLGAKADLVGGYVPLSQLPPQALPNVVPVANQAAMLALTTAQVQYGDICLITGTSAQGTYILTGSDPSQLANWTEIATPTAPVVSVNGLTGTVVLGASDVGALAANASIPISQVTGLSTQLGTFASTSALTSGLATKTAFGDVQSMLANSSFTKRADYVATATLPSLAGLQSVDGVLIPAGAIVLVTAQPSSVNNGLWVASSGSWTRPADFATGSWLVKDTLVFVSNATASAAGLTNPYTIWQMQAASGFIDTGANNWTKIGYINPPFTPVAGNGISIAGSTFSANVTSGQGILATGSGLQSDPNIVPRKFVGTVPSGGTVAGITHNLNTTSPVVSIWDTGSNTLVLAGITVTSANSISIEFNTAPTTGQYKVCIIG